MTDLNELLKAIPVGDIAKQIGVPEGVAEAAVQQVLPGLVSGLAANAQSETGAKSLEKALTKHSGKKVASLKDVDTEDGEKIVGHVFGAKKNEVATKLAGNSSVGEVTGDIIQKILPIVAPIVLAWLANKFFGGSTETAKAEPEPQASAGGGIGDLLGGLLGSKQGSDALGGLLGGLLGGGR